MKFAEELFPLGSFEKQQTAGAYIDGTLASNLDILAKKIKNDMHFCGIITGHDAVRNGKSTIATQVATYLTWKINQLHGTNLEFTDKNVVMLGRDLERTSLELPKFSVVLLDEGDDLTTHGSKELAIRIKRYFRKCGQLNQILLLILPSFFELPKFFALNRSHFLIDCKFHGEFERGIYSFYSARNKKLLYLKGKKEWNYEAFPHDFGGCFTGHYYFFPNLKDCVEKYLEKKRKDLEENDEIDDKKRPKELRREITAELFYKLYNNLGNFSIKKLSELFGISKSTGTDYIKYIQDKKNEGRIDLIPGTGTKIKHLIIK